MGKKPKPAHERPAAREIRCRATPHTLSLATSKAWRHSEDRRQERTTWHDVVVYGGAAKVAMDYVHKGDKLALEGSIETRDFDDRDGVKRMGVEVVIRPYLGELTLLSPKF